MGLLWLVLWLLQLLVLLLGIQDSNNFLAFPVDKILSS